MTSALAGRKAEFAIEYTIAHGAPNDLGHCRLWIGGQFLGCIEDTGILGATAHILNRLENRKEIHFPPSVLNSPQKLFTRISRNHRLNDECLLNLGEGFDDFEAFAFRTRSNFVF